MRSLTAWGLILWGTMGALAGQFNSERDIGDIGPAWKDLPGVDGKNHSLSDISEPVVVVVFTCNSCPIAVDYEDRIIALAKRHAGKAAFVAINVNRVPEDSLPKMKERSDARQFPFLYLFDESQQIAKEYGAVFTPEFFVLDKDRKIVYMGGLDDNSDPSQVKNKYLEPAIEAALQGTAPTVAETVARGCRVRYAREKRGSKEPK